MESIRDPLTGFWNHGQFHDLLDLEFRRYQRSREPFCLLLLEPFGRTTDRAGHPLLDHRVREVASLIERNTRDSDIATRDDGEKFAVILLKADQAAGTRIANRLLAACRRDSMRCGHIFTLSAGLSVAGETAHNTRELAAAAASALEQAKRLGGDQVASVRWKEFTYRSKDSVRFVGIGGDWNDWTPATAALRRVEERAEWVTWRGRFLVPTGKSRYKYRVDLTGDTGGSAARWISDPNCALTEPDGFGGRNSIAVVEPYSEEWQRI